MFFSFLFEKKIFLGVANFVVRSFQQNFFATK